MATYYNDNTVVFLDGRLGKAAEAKTDLFSQSLHYGYSVFEGIRSYQTAGGGTRIFKAKEHFERLINSARELNIPFAYTIEELTDATYEVLHANNLQDAYIRPLVFSPANMGFNKNDQSHLLIAVWEMPLFFGEKLLKIVTSSFERPNPKAFKITAKASGHYVNSILASQEAKSKGYDEALLLDINGNVAEGTGANVFFEKNKKLYTPAPGNILPGITRATVMEICDQLGIQVEEGFFKPEEFRGADSGFYCGTAAEIVGLESLDNILFKTKWKDSQGHLIQNAYKALVREKVYDTRDLEIEKSTVELEE